MIIGSAFGFCQLILNSQSSGSQVLGPPEDKSVYNSSQELSLWVQGCSKLICSTEVRWLHSTPQ